VLDDLWARLLDSLERTLPTPVLDNWVRPCRLLAVEGDHLRIGAPNKFSRDWLAQNYLDALHQAAREVLGTKGTTDTVHRALAEVVRRERLRRLGERRFEDLAPEVLDELRRTRA